MAFNSITLDVLDAFMNYQLCLKAQCKWQQLDHWRLCSLCCRDILIMIWSRSVAVTLPTYRINTKVTQ